MTTDASEREPLRAAHVMRFGQLTMNSERDADLHTIELIGELDLANAPEVEEEFKRVEATDAGALILNLAGLTFIDSTGIRLLITARARSLADFNRLTLLRAPAAVHRVFEIAGVGDLLPFAD